MRSDYDHISKYHAIQRGSYIIIYALLPIQAFTGFALMWPNALLGVFAGFAGGIDNVTAWARLAHSMIMRIYLLLAVTHGSLSIYEGFPSFKYFWFGLKDPLPNAHPSGEGDHDH